MYVLHIESNTIKMVIIISCLGQSTEEKKQPNNQADTSLKQNKQYYKIMCN